MFEVLQQRHVHSRTELYRHLRLAEDSNWHLLKHSRPPPLLTTSSKACGLSWRNNSLVCWIYSSCAFPETFFLIIVEKYLSECNRDSGNTFSRVNFFRQGSKYLHSTHTYSRHHPRFQLKVMEQILMTHYSLDQSPQRYP